MHVLVSERELDGPPPIARLLELAAPVAVHLRARISTRRLHALAAELAPGAAVAGSWIVVNGRPDVALAAGANAVQLGRAALGVAEARRMLDVCAGRLAIGASVHGAEGALRAAREGADYLVLGTIYATPSHPGIEGSGPGAVSAVRRRLASHRLASHRLAAHRPSGRGPLPILAIGGVRADRIEEVTEAGAYGIVVGRAVWSAPDPVRAAIELRDRMDRRDR